MKVYKYNPLDPVDLKEFFKRMIQRSGIIKRQYLETFVVHEPIWKPFRVVKFTIKDMRGNQTSTCTSLLDEMLTSQTSSRNDMILLWRPKYSEIDTMEISDSYDIEPSVENEDAINQYISEFVFLRTESQFELLEIDSELKKIYRRESGSMTLVMPQSPKMRWRERDLAMDKKSVKGFFLASSIVTNAPQGYWIADFELEDRIFVQTFLTEFKNIESGTRRFVLLENTGENSVVKSFQYGKSLTILCERNPKCKEKIESAFNI